MKRSRTSSSHERLKFPTGGSVPTDLEEFKERAGTRTFPVTEGFVDSHVWPTFGGQRASRPMMEDHLARRRTRKLTYFETDPRETEALWQRVRQKMGDERRHIPSDRKNSGMYNVSVTPSMPGLTAKEAGYEEGRIYVDPSQPVKSMRIGKQSGDRGFINHLGGVEYGDRAPTRFPSSTPRGSSTASADTTAQTLDPAMAARRARFGTGVPATRPVGEAGQRRPRSPEAADTGVAGPPQPGAARPPTRTVTEESPSVAAARRILAERAKIAAQGNPPQGHKRGGSITGHSQYRDSYMSEDEGMERRTKTRRKTSSSNRRSHNSEGGSEYQNALRMMGLKV